MRISVPDASRKWVACSRTCVSLSVGQQSHHVLMSGDGDRCSDYTGLSGTRPPCHGKHPTSTRAVCTLYACEPVTSVDGVAVVWRDYKLAPSRPNGQRCQGETLLLNRPSVCLMLEDKSCTYFEKFLRSVGCADAELMQQLNYKYITQQMQWRITGCATSTSASTGMGDSSSRRLTCYRKVPKPICCCAKSYVGLVIISMQHEVPQLYQLVACATTVLYNLACLACLRGYKMCQCYHWPRYT